MLFFAFVCIFFSLPVLAAPELEVGAKIGPGYKGNDKFDNEFQNYQYNILPGVYSTTTYRPPRNLFLSEIFFKKQMSPNHKIGFALGYVNFDPFSLKAIDTLGEITTLNMNLSSVYFLVTYHYEHHLKRSRNTSIEGGFGMGAGQALLLVSGNSITPYGYTPINGSLAGSGLQFKLEGSVNRRVSDILSLQLGLMLSMTAIASFNGSIDESGSSFYVTGNGSITSFTPDQFANYAYTNKNFSRTLDMKIAYTVLYFSAVMLF